MLSGLSRPWVLLLWFGREPSYDIDQLGVRGAFRIAEFCDRVSIGKLAELDQLADPLVSIERQIRRAASEQEVPQLALAEQMVELACRYIDQEQHHNPKLDRDKAVPGKGCYLVPEKTAEYIVSAEQILDPMFDHAGNEDGHRIKHGFK
jgi:hypothetical protein